MPGNTEDTNLDTLIKKEIEEESHETTQTDNLKILFEETRRYNNKTKGRKIDPLYIYSLSYAESSLNHDSEEKRFAFGRNGKGLLMQSLNNAIHIIANNPDLLNELIISSYLKESDRKYFKGYNDKKTSKDEKESIVKLLSFRVNNFIKIPQVNARISIEGLGDDLDKYEGNYELVTAEHNAGSGCNLKKNNIRHWKNPTNKKYTSTRNHVGKVMKYYTNVEEKLDPEMRELIKRYMS